MSRSIDFAGACVRLKAVSGRQCANIVRATVDLVSPHFRCDMVPILGEYLYAGSPVLGGWLMLCNSSLFVEGNALDCRLCSEPSFGHN
jgi:hypothetical protein